MSLEDFAAIVHFRTAIGSELRAEGFVGGYSLIFGRFGSWREFRRESDRHLQEEGVHFVEWEDRRRLDPDSLDPDQLDLFENLDQYPIQYNNWHMYPADEA